MSEKKEADRSRGSAGLAGAGGGTLVAVVANELPDSSFLKVPLLYCAPSISLVLTLVWVWLQVRIASYFREREVRNLIEDLRTEIERKLQDPDISEDIRAQLQKELDDLNLISVQRLKERLQSLNVITAEDFSESPELGDRSSQTDILN